MKKFITISLIFILAYGCASKTAHENAAPADAMMAKEEAASMPEPKSAAEDLPEYEFGKEYLSLSNLTAFEERAVEKLFDFADYVAIVSDQSLDQPFREQAAEMALELFESPEVRVALQTPYSNDRGNLTVKELLADIAKKPKLVYSLALSDVQIAENLRASEPEVYEGTISYRQTLSNTEGFRLETDATMQIIARKYEKSFGEKIIEVWEVKLAGN